MHTALLALAALIVFAALVAVTRLRKQLEATDQAAPQPDCAAHAHCHCHRH